MTSENQKNNRRLEDIRLILKDLLKVIKVVSMYPENNPLPQSLRRTFAEKLVSIIDEHGQFEIFVEKEQLLVDSETVFRDRTKEDSLAGLFFSTGITRCSLEEDLDVKDVYKILDAIKTYQNNCDGSADLAGILWENQINGFAFKTVEDIALADYDGDFRVQEVFQAGGNPDDSGVSRQKYDALFAPIIGLPGEDGLDDGILLAKQSQPGDFSPVDNLIDESIIKGGIFNAPGQSMGNQPVGNNATVLEAANVELPDIDSLMVRKTVFDGDNAEDNQSLRILEAVDAMGMGEVAGPAAPIPDATLILNSEVKLSEEEEIRVREIAREDASFDVYDSTAELLKEMLHQETDMTGFYETVTIIEKILSEFVEAGQIPHATGLLQYAKTIEDKVRRTKPLWAERLKETLITQSSREQLLVLSRALNESPEIGTRELRAYLDNFGWEALLGVTDLLSHLEHSHHREAVGNYLSIKGGNNMEIVAQGIYDKNPTVVCSSVVVLARIGGRKTLGHFKRLIKHDNIDVRLTLVKELQNSPDDVVLELLQQLVADKDAQVRKEAVRSIVARRGQSAFDTITDILNSEDFATLEPDDQQDILNAYSFLGGDAAVEYLVSLIKRLNPLRNDSLTYYRAAAFEALSRNRGEKSEKALVKLASNWRPGVKTAAVEAIRKRRQLIFGASDEDEE